MDLHPYRVQRFFRRAFFAFFFRFFFTRFQRRRLRADEFCLRAFAFGLSPFRLRACVVEPPAGDIEQEDRGRRPVDQKLRLWQLPARLEPLHDRSERRREHRFLDRQEHIRVILAILRSRFNRALLRAEQDGYGDVRAAGDLVADDVVELLGIERAGAMRLDRAPGRERDHRLRVDLSHDRVDRIDLLLVGVLAGDHGGQAGAVSEHRLARCPVQILEDRQRIEERNQARFAVEVLLDRERLQVNDPRCVNLDVRC